MAIKIWEGFCKRQEQNRQIGKAIRMLQKHGMTKSNARKWLWLDRSNWGYISAYDFIRKGRGESVLNLIKKEFPQKEHASVDPKRIYFSRKSY